MSQHNKKVERSFLWSCENQKIYGIVGRPTDRDNRNNFKEDAGGSGIPVTCAILPSDKHQIAAF
jgi:hypothetical protein